MVYVDFCRGKSGNLSNSNYDDDDDVNNNYNYKSNLFKRLGFIVQEINIFNRGTFKI